MIKEWISKLKSGLSKSSNLITEGLTNIFKKKKLDKESIALLEDLLYSSDMGIGATNFIIQNIKENKFDKEIDELSIKNELSELIEKILIDVEKPIELNQERLEVILICGVNGNGKTTTIGKLANYYKNQGKKVAVAACDTFRAAAVEQLKIWADRLDVEFIAGYDKSDPASVAYEAIERSMKSDADILLIDTAGRLQNKINLMEELSKIIRIIKKLIPDAPHHTILVIDATTGQNAYSQVENFNKIVNLTGLILTKLDGTAKAGIIVGVAEKFKLPVHAIGIGESVDDLRPFNAKDFARNLIGI